MDASGFNPGFGASMDLPRRISEQPPTSSRLPVPSPLAAKMSGILKPRLAPVYADDGHPVVLDDVHGRVGAEGDPGRVVELVHVKLVLDQRNLRFVRRTHGPQVASNAP